LTTDCDSFSMLGMPYPSLAPAILAAYRGSATVTKSRILVAFPWVGGVARANRVAVLAERSPEAESEGGIERAKRSRPGVSGQRDGSGTPGPLWRREKFPLSPKPGLRSAHTP